MTRSLRNPFVTVYREVALDYFYRMGGAGRYQGFQEWHPALLALACALEATGEYSFEELGIVWSRLPTEIVEQCDGLRQQVTHSFTKGLEPFRIKSDCVRKGAELLIQELNTGNRGKPLSYAEHQLVKRVKLEYDLAFSFL